MKILIFLLAYQRIFNFFNFTFTFIRFSSFQQDLQLRLLLP